MAIGYFGGVDGIKNVTLADLSALRAHLLTKGNVRVSVEAPEAMESKTVAAALDALVAKLPEGVGYKPRATWVGGKVEVSDNPNVERASVAVGFPVAPFGKREFWAACILREMLSGDGGTLVEDKQLPARLGVTSDDSSDWKDWPMQALDLPMSQRPYLAVHAVCSPDAVDDARDAVFDHMKVLAAGHFPDDKLWRARRRVANGWARDLSPIGQRTELRGVAALSGADLPDTKAVTALVNAVPRAMLQSVAQDMIAHAAVGVQVPRD
jgi:predicted Zn-dependent peptidase